MCVCEWMERLEGGGEKVLMVKDKSSCEEEKKEGFSWNWIFIVFLFVGECYVFVIVR